MCQEKNNTKIKWIFSLIICVSAFMSCAEIALKEELNGVWLIDSMIVNQVDIQREYRHNGMMIWSLEKENIIYIPKHKGETVLDGYNQGSWRIYTEDDGTAYFIIRTNDPIFQDTFVLSLVRKDSISLLEMKNKRVKITCRKDIIFPTW